jgi:hypothetical protein
MPYRYRTSGIFRGTFACNIAFLIQYPPGTVSYSGNVWAFK